MLTTQEAQARVDALTTEAAALEGALLELEGQKGTLGQELDAAFILAERDPSKDHERNAVQLESRANLLNNQARRKKVALESVKTDLVDARANLECAQKAAVVVEMEGLHTEIIGLCAELDKSLTNYTAWGNLREALLKARKAWAVLRPANEAYRLEIYPEIRVALNRTIETFQIRLAQALNPTAPPSGAEVKFATLGDAMELELVAKRIANLRRVHIETLEQAAAPEAVPVLAAIA